MEHNNIISYAAFLKDRDKFRGAGTRTGSDFNIYDTPSHKFFKILFYFWNGDTENSTRHSGGLLAPTWEIYDSLVDYTNSDTDLYYVFDSAWSYLKNNDENERAEKLEQFVALLSNINCECPWYFSEISGLGEAMNRKATVSQYLKLEEERKKITIKCLPDSYDNRIEVLLSLYRDIVWSWSKKKEIIPANLRKFDMGIYIWESPIYALNSDTVLDETSESYSASYKLLEFHNCEIDYDSIKSGYETMSNKEGVSPEFSIDILFDDVYEHAYNSLMMRTIGDVIVTDTAEVIYGIDGSHTYNYESIAQGEEGSKYNDSDKIFDNETNISEKLIEASTRDNYWMEYDLDADRSALVKELLPGHKGPYQEKGFVGNLLSQVGGAIVKDVKSAANRLLLGNLYTYSISKMADQLKGVLNGQVFTALNAVDEYAGTNMMGGMHNHSLNNIAGRGQKLLNNYVNDKRLGRNGEPVTNLGVLNEGFHDTTPSAHNSYQSTTLDRSEPEHVMGDIFPTIPMSERVKSLGNLNQARTLINNI